MPGPRRHARAKLHTTNPFRDPGLPGESGRSSETGRRRNSRPGTEVPPTPKYKLATASLPDVHAAFDKRGPDKMDTRSEKRPGLEAPPSLECPSDVHTLSPRRQARSNPPAEP